MSAVVDLKILIATVVTLGGKFSVPLDWILARHRYNDRRRVRRLPERLGRPGVQPVETATETPLDAETIA
jgi:hypothetical protein